MFGVVGESQWGHVAGKQFSLQTLRNANMSFYSLLIRLKLPTRQAILPTVSAPGSFSEGSTALPGFSTLWHPLHHTPRLSGTTALSGHLRRSSLNHWTPSDSVPWSLSVLALHLVARDISARLLSQFSIPARKQTTNTPTVKQKFFWKEGTLRSSFTTWEEYRFGRKWGLYFNRDDGRDISTYIEINRIPRITYKGTD